MKERFSSLSTNHAMMLGGIILVAALFRFWNLDWHLPATFHADEHNIVLRALRFGTGDLNPHFFLYGSLLMYLSAAGYGLYFVIGYLTGIFDSLDSFAVAFFLDPTPVYLISRSISALSGTLAVAATFLLGQRVCGPVVGLTAAALIAVYPTHVFYSHFALPPSLAVLLLTIAYVLAFDGKSDQEPSNRRLVAFGFVGGLAIAASVLAAFGMAIAGLCVVLRYRGNFTGMAKAFALIAIAAAVGLFVGEPFFFLDFKNVAYELRGMSSLQNDRTQLSIFTGGFTDYVSNLGVVGIAAAVLGAGLAWRRKRLDLVISVVGMVAVFAYFARRGTAPQRYLLVILPLICVLVGLGTEFVLRWIGRRSSAVGMFGAAVILLALLVPPMARSYGLVLPLGFPDTRVRARDWIYENIPSNSRIMLIGPESRVPRLLENRERARQLAAESAKKFSDSDSYPNLETYYRFKVHAADRSSDPTYWLMRLKLGWWAKSESPEGLISLYQIVPRNLPPSTQLLTKSLDEYRLEDEIEYVVGTSWNFDAFDNSKFPSVQSFLSDIRAQGKLLHAEEPGKDVTGPTVWIWQLRSPTS